MILGWIMIVAVFVGIFAAIAYDLGIKAAAIISVSAVILTAFIVVGFSLITGVLTL